MMDQKRDQTLAIVANGNIINTNNTNTNNNSSSSSALNNPSLSSTRSSSSSLSSSSSASSSSSSSSPQSSDSPGGLRSVGDSNSTTSSSSSSSSSSTSSSSSSTSTSSPSSSSNVTAFLSKLWRLVNDQANDDLICWSQSGCSFVIMNQIQFAKNLLPLYFKHSNMASFIRQLNMYGFKKIPIVDTSGASDKHVDFAQFYHINFIRGQEHRLSSVKRKSNSSRTHNLIVNGSFCEDVRSMLTEVKSIRDSQSSSDSILGSIQVDNKSLWRDVAMLRSQHLKQRHVIDKLIQFLLSLIQSRSNLGANKKRKMRMINNAAHLDSLGGASSPSGFQSSADLSASSPEASIMGSPRVDLTGNCQSVNLAADPASRSHLSGLLEMGLGGSSVEVQSPAGVLQMSSQLARNANSSSSHEQQSYLRAMNCLQVDSMDQRAQQQQQHQVGGSRLMAAAAVGLMIAGNENVDLRVSNNQTNNNNKDLANQATNSNSYQQQQQQQIQIHYNGSNNNSNSAGQSQSSNSNCANGHNANNVDNQQQQHDNNRAICHHVTQWTANSIYNTMAASEQPNGRLAGNSSMSVFADIDCLTSLEANQQQQQQQQSHHHQHHHQQQQQQQHQQQQELQHQQRQVQQHHLHPPHGCFY